jgi:hypothetical protein
VLPGSPAQTLLPQEPVKVEGILKQVWADWLKPLDNEDKPVAFPSSLYHPIHIEALLHNVPTSSSPASGEDDGHQLLVYVTLPDRTSQLWPLRAGDLQPLGGNRFKLNTTINLYVNQLKYLSPAARVSLACASSVPRRPPNTFWCAGGPRHAR